MASIKLKHSGGNGVIIAAPTSNPASDKTLTLPSDVDGTVVSKDSSNSLQNIAGINGGQFANRNKLINGGMTVSQRGTSFTTGDNAEHFSADRWVLYAQNTGSRFTITQSTDTPDGFGNSVKIDCTTADTSLASNEEVQFYQKIEGFNTQDFAKGTSAAKQYTLSFYVKTNKTGTYIVRLLGRDNTASHVAASYTVSDSNWNRYTITFPADTTSGRGDNNDNGEALRVVWWLVAGSGVNSGSLQTTWANSSDTGAATGQVNFADSTSNDFFITGCQLEVGDTATDFEHRSFGQELALCQRYFFSLGDGVNGVNIAQGIKGSATSARYTIPFPVPMRAAPTITFNALKVDSETSGSYQDITSVSFNTATTTTSRLALVCDSSAGQGNPCTLLTSSTSSYLRGSAEL